MKNKYNRFIVSGILIGAGFSLHALDDLNKIIQPAHQEDYLYHQLYLLAKHEPLSTILEIGSSSGGGTTEALVLAVIQNECRPRLFCMEISRPRFEILADRYSHLSSVKCYLASSVPPDDFLSEDEIIDTLTRYPELVGRNMTVQNVLDDRRRDIEYARNANVPKNGIELIKQDHHINNFDMVVIDGSAFTTIAEVKLIYGAYIIALDGIYGIKNATNYRELCNDPTYEIIKENDGVQHNYAIFKRKKVD